MAYLTDEDDFFGNQAVEDEAKSSDNMLQHEMKFLKNKFHNIGFQEAYDQANTDSKLEEGFVDGFCELIDIAIKIGNNIGEVASESILSDLTQNKDADASKDQTTKATEKNSTKEVFLQTRKDLVSFLDCQKDGFYCKGEAEIYFANLESRISKMKKNESL